MIYWIDTRTPEEYQAGHLPGAVLIPYEVIGDRIGEVTNDKNADIRVYCRSGRRSGVAKDTLEALGFTRVTNEGGYEDILKRPR
jgi:phage shock protein E